MKIWIFLPAYNEEKALEKLLPKLQDVLSARADEYCVVTVDDGSRDGTAAVLERFKDTLPLETITHAINRGLGETERDGFEFIAARCEDDDVVVRLDCDDTHEPANIIAMVNAIGDQADVVVASRFASGGGQLGVPSDRAWISQAANLFMKLMFNIPGVKDYSCGYRAYRGRVLKDAIRIFGNSFIQLRGLGFTSTLETIVKLNMLGCRFAEVPFVLRYDQKVGSSKMVTSLTTLGYMVLAFVHHWPFGGWRTLYRDLGATYQNSPADAHRQFNRAVLKHTMISKLGGG